jgi:hypothetical protein
VVHRRFVWVMVLPGSNSPINRKIPILQIGQGGRVFNYPCLLPVPWAPVALALRESVPNASFGNIPPEIRSGGFG